MVYHRKNRFLNYSNSMARSSRPDVFLRKGVPKICSKFTGEHPCRSAISIKLLCNFIEIALPHACSPLNLLHIFRTPFTRNTSGRLLLNDLTESITKLSSFFYATTNKLRSPTHYFPHLVCNCYYKTLKLF